MKQDDFSEMKIVGSNGESVSLETIYQFFKARMRRENRRGNPNLGVKAEAEIKPLQGWTPDADQDKSDASAALGNLVREMKARGAV